MTVQDMDLCLNISVGPTSTPSQKKPAGTEDSILNTIKGLKSQKLNAEKNTATTGLSQYASTESASKKRVKQKSLAAIVAKNARKSSIVSKPKNLGKRVTWNLDSVSTSDKDSEQKSIKTPSKVERVKESVKSLSAETNANSDVPSISFTKPTRENVGKTLFAKKRNISETGLKSLAGVFSKNEESKDTAFNLLPSSEKEGSEEVPVPHKRLKFDQSDKLQFEAKKGNVKYKARESKERSVKKQNIDTDGSKTPHSKYMGKISSLFGHNPEVPNIGQKFVKPIDEQVFTVTTFADLNFHPYTISNLEQNFQITKMTTVQQKAIPQILLGRDVLVRSQTGSGKTLAYALPIIEALHKIRPKLTRSSGLQALVVVPSRELALQSYECFLKLVKPFTWIVPGYLTGGEKRKAEKARLRKGCNILVGTPGRLLDHIKHTVALKLYGVKYFVLDEADRMFDMGYEKDISGIVSALKTSTPNSNTGYDPMNILRKNVKKVFTDEEVDQLENTATTTDAENKDTAIKSEEDLKPKQPKDLDYHSSSDGDSDSGGIYVRIKKRHRMKAAKSTVKDESSSLENTDSTNEPSSTVKSGKQTILLSATLTQAVEKLAGLAMEDPVFVDAARENLQNADGDESEINEDLIVPQSVVQTYIVTPPKLRMVTLSGYITGKCKSHGEHKIVIFMATQDMVDYHADILSSVLSRPVDEDDEDSDPLVDVEFFKLHGNMTQKERMDVFKTFRQARSGVLLCTDVAARGLDMPKVDCVIQYTGPLSARDYVHRIGRTARAGSSGSATIFLTPPEIEFVRMLESRRIRIKQEDMNDTLDKLLGPLSRHNSAQAAAIALQNEFETLIVENKALREKAYKAYLSWVRFYSSYPRDMRKIFKKKELHLGHYAKSFALRDAPQRIGGMGKTLGLKTPRKQHNNRLSNEPAEGRQQKKPRIEGEQRQQRISAGMLKKVRMLNTSEYGSGLEPLKKPKKS